MGLADAARSASEDLNGLADAFDRMRDAAAAAARTQQVEAAASLDALLADAVRRGQLGEFLRALQERAR